jgi:hypothetical protein
MKLKIIIIFFGLTLLFSCGGKGDYQYIIYMKDGSKVKAWSVSSSGGGLSVIPPLRTKQNHYYLSSNEYIKAEYVGVQNDSK